MTFTRGVFAFALGMLILGIVGSKFLVGYLFGDLQGPPLPRVVAASSSRAPVSRPQTRTGHRTSGQSHALPPGHATHATSVRRSFPTARPLAVRLSPRGAAANARRVAARRRAISVRSAQRRQLTSPQPTSTPTPATGTVSLARHWVGTQQVRQGGTIEVGYVIDNETGRAERVTLGASLKSSRALDWTTSAVSDPYHDVVAIVPPGVTTHIRFFTLPRQLPPGQYDVAWGLRDTTTGQREALVVAPEALQATRR